MLNDMLKHEDITTTTTMDEDTESQCLDCNQYPVSSV